jgi:hypothetical protein
MRTRGDAARTPTTPMTAEALRAAGFTRVTSEAELRLLMGLCDACAGGRRRGEKRPPPGCVHGHPARPALPALPRCTLWAPKGGSRCYDAPSKCCKGWDCGTRPLGCAEAAAALKQDAKQR